MSQNPSQRKKDSFYHPSLPQLPEEAGAKHAQAQGTTTCIHIIVLFHSASIYGK